MKKLFLSLIVACTVVGAASAQEYMSIGLGYASDTYNWTAYGEDQSFNFQSLGLVLEGFTGDPLGLYSAVSIGAITKGTGTSGSFSSDFNFTPYELKVHFDALLGLGYRFLSGDFDFIVAGGVGFASTYLIPSDEYASSTSITYMTLGPGATVAAAYNLSPKTALYASMRGFYGVAQITEFTSTFTHSVVISPSAGLRIRIR